MAEFQKIATKLMTSGKSNKILKWQIIINCHNRKSQYGRISKTAIIGKMADFEKVTVNLP
jgi:hypothetical protein